MIELIIATVMFRRVSLEIVQTCDKWLTGKTSLSLTYGPLMKLMLYFIFHTFQREMSLYFPVVLSGKRNTSTQRPSAPF